VKFIRCQPPSFCCQLLSFSAVGAPLADKDRYGVGFFQAGQKTLYLNNFGINRPEASPNG
jgi:hypothetical protein